MALINQRGDAADVRSVHHGFWTDPRPVEIFSQRHGKTFARLHSQPVPINSFIAIIYFLKSELCLSHIAEMLELKLMDIRFGGDDGMNAGNVYPLT